MKPLSSIRILSLTLTLTLTGVIRAEVEKTTTSETTVAPGKTTVTETSRTAVLPDPSLTKTEGVVKRLDLEKKMIFVKTALGEVPIGHHWNEATTVIDLDGKPVDRSLVKRDVPVIITWAADGNDLIAKSILVKRYQAPLPGGGVTLTARETRKEGGVVVETKEKTTVITTASGTISSLDGDIVALNVKGQDQPIRYRRTETTKIISASGDPVLVEELKAGTPVRVKFVQKGADFFAEELVMLPPPVKPAE